MGLLNIDETVEQAVPRISDFFEIKEFYLPMVPEFGWAPHSISGTDPAYKFYTDRIKDIRIVFDFKFRPRFNKEVLQEFFESVVEYLDIDEETERKIKAWCYKLEFTSYEDKVQCLCKADTTEIFAVLLKKIL